MRYLDADEDPDYSIAVGLTHADNSTIDVTKIKPAALFHCCLT